MSPEEINHLVYRLDKAIASGQILALTLSGAECKYLAGVLAAQRREAQMMSDAATWRPAPPLDVD